MPATQAQLFGLTMIDFDFSPAWHAICRWTSAEVKSYTQHHCYAENSILDNITIADANQPLLENS